MRQAAYPDAVLYYIFLPDFFKANIRKCGVRNSECGIENETQTILDCRRRTKPLHAVEEREYFSLKKELFLIF
jgi:hypothetical protein